jgi:hypothetical protein
MATQNWPENKADFQAHLSDAWVQLQTVLDSFSEEQMTERTDAGGWTVKDHLAHLATWERGIIALLRRQPRYEAMGLDAATVQNNDEGELNRKLRAQFVNASLSEVRENLRDAHDGLAALVDSLEPDDLLKTYSAYQPGEPGEDTGEPVLRWVVGNSSGHYLEHLPWIKRLATGSG